jgi:O-antigen ligase
MLGRPIVWLLSLAFTGLLAAAVAYEFWLAALVPLLLWAVYLIWHFPDRVVLGVVFCTPLSVLVDVKPLGAAISLPTEPLLMGLLCWFVARLIIEGRYDSAAFKHPVTLTLLAYFGWMLICSINSSIPLVSFKFLLSNLWFVVGFYLLPLQIFRQRARLHTFIWLYLIPLSFLIAWSIVRHGSFGFTKQASYWASEPFVINHGIYGAMVAFFIPILAIYLAKSRVFLQRRSLLIPMYALLFLFLTGLILSYTRAAWLGTAAAFLFYVLLRLGLRFRMIPALAAVLLAVFFVFQGDITMKLMRNKTDSHDDLGKHLRSISNVRTDASNLERLNRWASGFRMLQERPLMGWGPGTYMFQYAPFQKPGEKTIISTNQADVGGIHSEYFNPLVEMGLPGMLLFLLLISFSLQRGMRYFRKQRDDFLRCTCLMALLGMVTYLTHGLLNNYLDFDKTTVLFWGFMAMMVGLEVYHPPVDEPAALGDEAPPVE